MKNKLIPKQNSDECKEWVAIVDNKIIANGMDLSEVFVSAISKSNGIMPTFKKQYHK